MITRYVLISKLHYFLYMVIDVNLQSNKNQPRSAMLFELRPLSSM